MDAPNRHPAIKVSSAHSKLVACVTITVLVNCEREPQYFPNLDVAKSAAAAPTWRGHMARVIKGSGNLNSKLSVPRAARMVQLPHFEGPNVAVESLFGMWDSFRNSKVMWRPNPEMPRGDVTPKGCRRTLTVAQLRGHRPVKSVPPSRPLNPTVTPAAPHVDKAAFPALPPSARGGIRGIPGNKNFPMGKERLIAKALLRRSPWTSRLPRTVSLEVPHKSERIVPDPTPQAGTGREWGLKARPPRLRLLINLGSPRGSLAVRARLLWVKCCSRQEGSSPRGKALDPCLNIPLERSIRSTIARSLVRPLLSSSINQVALISREPPNNQSRHGTPTRTCRWLPCMDICKR